MRTITILLASSLLLAVGCGPDDIRGAGKGAAVAKGKMATPLRQ